MPKLWQWYTNTRPCKSTWSDGQIDIIPNRPSTNNYQINLWFDVRNILMISLRKQQIHQNELLGQQSECQPPSCINMLDVSISKDKDLAKWQAKRHNSIKAWYYLCKTINCSQDSSVISLNIRNNNICQKCSPKLA